MTPTVIVIVVNLSSLALLILICCIKLRYQVSSIPTPAPKIQKLIDTLPTFHFPSVTTANNLVLVCLSEFKHLGLLHLLPRCRHGFHVKCIDH